MFFQSINDMLGEGDTLVFMVNKGKEGTLHLTITPKGTFKNANLGTGLSVEATPEQLDTELGANLSRYTVARRSLQEQIEAAAIVLDSASKAVASDAVKRMASKPTEREKPVSGKSEAAQPRESAPHGELDEDEDSSSGVSLF